MKKEYMIVFDPEKCTQCHGCETACKVWRELPCGVRYRRVLNIWHGGYPLIKSHGISLACLHCVEPDCLTACPADAIAKDKETGQVRVDPALCIACQTCAQACPFGIPQFDETNIMQKCDLCLDQMVPGMAPPCVGTCPGQALARQQVTPEEKKAREKETAAILERFTDL